MTNIPKSFYKTDQNLVANLAMVCKVALKDKEKKEIPMYYTQVLFRGAWLSCCAPYSTREEGREALLLKRVEYPLCEHRLVKCEALDD